MMARSTFGSIAKRGRNVYLVRWHDGSGCRHSKTIHGTRAVAEDFLAEVRCGLVSDGGKPTLADYYEGSVEPTFAALAPRSRTDYERAWPMLAPLHGVELELVTFSMFQSFLDGLPSYSQQNAAFVLMRRIMNQAMRDRLVQFNPLTRKALRFKRANRHCKSLLYTDEVRGFMDGIRGCKYEPVVLCLIGAGLRPEEARALRWEDVSLLESDGRLYMALSVSKTMVSTGLQGFTKNEASEREAIMGEPFASRMEEIRSTGFLCDNGSGMPTSPATMARNWKAWCARNGIRHVTMGDMRSSYATNLGEIGAPDSLVSMNMGHTDGTTKGENYQRFTRRGGMLIADFYSDAISS